MESVLKIFAKQRSVAVRLGFVKNALFWIDRLPVRERAVTKTALTVNLRMDLYKSVVAAVATSRKPQQKSGSVRTH